MTTGHAIIALGSNIGDRRESLARAARALQASGITILRRSNLYWTRPWPPGAAQRPYLNAAILAQTHLGPLDLLDCLLIIERSLGRVRRERWEPRPIDLDLIAHAVGRFDHPRLALPHPRWRERDFVLAPLRDLGILGLPGERRSPSALLAELPAADRCIISTDTWSPSSC